MKAVQYIVLVFVEFISQRIIFVYKNYKHTPVQLSYRLNYRTHFYLKCVYFFFIANVWYTFCRNENNALIKTLIKDKDVNISDSLRKWMFLNWFLFRFVLANSCLMDRQVQKYLLFFEVLLHTYAIFNYLYN